MGIPRNNSVVELSKFRFDPYDQSYTRVQLPVHDASAAALPEGTLHTLLNGSTCFVPYPSEQFTKDKTPMPRNLVRLFVGQVPYDVSDMQLDWMAYVFCNQATIYSVERIVKRDKQTGRRLPGGCLHMYCTPEDAEALIAGLSKRLLIDDTGVWYARDEYEQDALDDYCAQLRSGTLPKFQERPYDSVVVEPAHSTYVPRK